MSREHEREQRLETLLQEWATRHILPPARSKSIRQAVLWMPRPAAPEVSIAWWHQLFGTLDVVLSRTTDMGQYLRCPQIA